MSTFLDNLAENVIRLRKEKKLTQEQLCDKAKIHLNTLYRIERKWGNPSWTTVQLIAEALGVEAVKLTEAAAK